MTERVREAVFASLGSQGVVEGARVLDLFAGTGAIGIEALSRGAREAVFVEADHAAAAIIQENLQITGLHSARVVRSDVLQFLRRCTESFDLAFADPPYRFDDWVALAANLPAELAVFESTSAIEAGPGWMITGTRRYGGSVVTFLRRDREAD